MMAPVNEMYAGEDQSWQDVYASYGCSLDFDVSGEDQSWQDVYASYGCSLDFDVSDDDG